MAYPSSGNGMFEDPCRILAHTLPNHRVRSLEIFEGGSTNLNVLVRFEAVDELVVLRQYRRGTEVCQKEVRLLQALQGLIPVPRFVKSDVTGNEAGIPYLIYRFLPGLTFRQIRATGSQRDMANAAHTIGRCLGVLQNCDISLFDACRLDRRRFYLAERQLAHPLLRERIGAADLHLLQQLATKWSRVSHSLDNEESLVHSDFNHRNILLNRNGDRWEVAGILDWELAGIGSSLWDAARFMCYEKPDSVYWEPHFAEAFHAQRGGSSLGDWKELSRVLNTFSAAASLASGSVQERFVPDLKRLVHAGLRGERIG